MHDALLGSRALVVVVVPPVFGIIKEQQAGRRFLLRGLANVAAEWTVLATAFSLGPAASHSIPGLTASLQLTPTSPQTRATPVRESPLLRILSPSRASQTPV